MASPGRAASTSSTTTPVERPRSGTVGGGGGAEAPAGSARGRWALLSAKLFPWRAAHPALPRMSSADDMFLATAAERPRSDDYWKYDGQNPSARPGYTSARAQTGGSGGGGGGSGSGGTDRSPAVAAVVNAATPSGPGAGTGEVGRTSPAAMGAGQWRARRLFKLDDLERLQVLGRGFFSEVSLVVDRSGDKYALKAIKEFKDAHSRLAFIQETETLRMLHHPNILRQRGVFVNATGLYVLTDYIERGTLRKLLKAKDVDITDRHKVHFAYDIAIGMRYLHEHTVMHRDLKSKNCLVNEAGRIIIADFGLAKHLPSPLAVSSDQAGSSYWMAPEMLRGQNYGLAADVFSYGIVLCEIITRLKAEPTDGVGIPRVSSFGLDVAQFREIAGTCLPALVELAIDCCQVDPAARPLFPAIVDRLEAMLAEVDAGQPDLHVPVPSATPATPATPATLLTMTDAATALPELAATALPELAATALPELAAGVDLGAADVVDVVGVVDVVVAVDADDCVDLEVAASDAGAGSQPTSGDRVATLDDGPTPTTLGDGPTQAMLGTGPTPTTLGDATPPTALGAGPTSDLATTRGDDLQSLRAAVDGSA